GPVSSLLCLTLEQLLEFIRSVASGFHRNVASGFQLLSSRRFSYHESSMWPDCNATVQCNLLLVVTIGKLTNPLWRHRHPVGAAPAPPLPTSHQRTGTRSRRLQKPASPSART